MPIDLIGAVVAWLVAACGDAGIGQVRDRRKLRKAVRKATDAVVAQVAVPYQDSLRYWLTLCFSFPPELKPTGTNSISGGIRLAIARQVTEFSKRADDTGRPFSESLQVELDWLTGEVIEALVGALRQVVAEDDLRALVYGMDTAEILDLLKKLDMKIPVAPATTQQGNAPPDGHKPAVGTWPSAMAGKDAWIAAVMAFADIEDPVFRNDVLRLMGDELSLGHPFPVPARQMARDHVIQIVSRCWDFKDPDAARRALAVALRKLRPDDGASEQLARLT
jgi:hypothetical protein